MMKYNICMIIETNSETRRTNQSAIVDSFLINFLACCHIKNVSAIVMLFQNILIKSFISLLF